MHETGSATSRCRSAGFNRTALKGHVWYARPISQASPSVNNMRASANKRLTLTWEWVCHPVGLRPHSLLSRHYLASSVAMHSPSGWQRSLPGAQLGETKGEGLRISLRQNFVTRRLLDTRHKTPHRLGMITTPIHAGSCTLHLAAVSIRGTVSMKCATPRPFIYIGFWAEYLGVCV
jgi:hypothetical protein